MTDLCLFFVSALLVFTVLFFVIVLVAFGLMLHFYGFPRPVCNKSCLGQFWSAAVGN